MDAFTTLTGIAAPLDLDNVDTDKIIPARFLKTIERNGLGRHLFEELRYDASGAERPDFVLNRPPWRDASILIAGANFGCGSSREHAPWALLDFGIRCVIAESFADIFFNNCFKNGMLPVILPRADIDRLLQDVHLGANSRLTVDLPAQRIHRPDGEAIAFDIDPLRKQRLVAGLDEIGETLRHDDAIARFEAARRSAQPWLPGTVTG